MRRKNPISLIILMLFIILVSNCKKEVNINKVETNTFLRTYPFEKSQECFSIFPSNDGGFIVLSANNVSDNFPRAITIIKVDAAGNFKWKTEINDTIAEPQVTILKDGSILLCSKAEIGILLKIDNQGKVVFKEKFVDYSGSLAMACSYPLQAANGDYYTSRTNGIETAAPSYNRINKFHPNGDYDTGFTINDLNFGGKIFVLYIYKYEEPQTYYLYGIFYPHPYDWKHNPRLFVSRFQMKGDFIISQKTTILDPNNISYRNLPFFKNYTNLRHINTPDNKLVISTFQRDHTGFNIGKIIKVDENLNKIWEIDLKIGNASTMPKSIIMGNDGNYLVSGSCNQEGKLMEQPFVSKISSGGKILWTKIYEMSKNSSFNTCYQAPDDAYYFGGTTNSFGGGLNLNDVFFMKTDKDGNLK